MRFVAGVTPEVPLDEIDAVPPLLSLLCAELNEQRVGPEDLIRPEQLHGRAEDILEKFYKSQQGLALLKPALRASKYDPRELALGVFFHISKSFGEELISAASGQILCAPHSCMDFCESLLISAKL
ncbi:MAG: hypothetical protein ABW214_04465 [Terrimicrobiaceae bacterium]